ncbi:alanyl-tRNA synthetase [Nannocystis exedens]|uniref:Alanine--tRNA ligase n=1 Tax=Nannocystis exedens TaxID=54 RepID=A0A1I2HCI4_9BACT|nr:alanine--tRNA ligase [Nannocystis exedens]PCC70042.1 alanine-tRNA ligase [Nannocystis exedens]SFF26476.1 alanyl-tRNA synthetase [Nannocystis exedens]
MQRPIRAHEIRSRFLNYFAARDHAVVPSSSLVPANDPTLLFTNAGMVQFKDTFLGRDPRPYKRAVTVQRCLRAGGKHNDLDNVGFTERHHTLFEMLGNFSFGDYFKQDAIRWGWEFLTEDLGIPADRLVVSVFSGEGESAPADDEAYELWTAYVPKDRIYRFPAKENFWAMGPTGPCGPCSEIHIFHGDKAPPDAGLAGRGPAHEDTRYTELWNLVFMQYEKFDDGRLVPLPKPSIDTGAGLERLASVLEGVGSNYRTSLLTPLVDLAKRLAGAPAHDLGAGEAPFRVIADHARATAFLIADGVFPDRDTRPYVLRRIMRRAIRFGEKVGLENLFFHEVCKKVVEEFGEAYPHLVERAATIDEVVRGEEESFRRTLKRGLRLFEGAVAELPAGETAFPLGVAAELYDTYGLPIDLTGILSREKGLTLDEEAVKQEVQARQAAGAAAANLGGGDKAIDNLYFRFKERFAGQATFTGYTELSTRGSVLALAVNGVEQTAAHEGDEVEFITDATPFYGESGGQVGDTGIAEGDGVRVEIVDTLKPTGDLHVHRGKVTRGTLEVGRLVTLTVDAARRAAIRRNHSATHLLHHALRAVLGTHVAQKGSLVAPDRLRFDFSHPRPITPEQRQQIERIVNEMTLANADTDTREMSPGDAKSAGAIGLFEAKYGEQVRVVRIGSDSVELCGGTHVHRAGDIGLFAIVSEVGIAQGVRRIEAVTGMNALQHLQQTVQILDRAASELHASGPSDVLEKLGRLQASAQKREREIAELQRKLAVGGGGSSDTVADVAGVKLLAKVVAVADPKALREAADTLRDRLGSGVIVLGAEKDGKASLLVAVTKDLAGKVHAGNLIAALASHVGGRGGGRPDLAQAGGPNAAGLPAAIEAAGSALAAQLG